jgi:lantibiotic modifying enzyme
MQDPPPFADILGPWLAARRLAAGGTPPAFGDTALLARLADIAGPVLLARLDERRTIPPLARLLDRTPPDAPRGAYASLASTGLDELLRPWPVLVDRVAQTADDHDAAMADFARHLEADSVALARTIPQWKQGVPAVAAARFGLSDPHGRGRTVGHITFADGVELAYKPRSLGVEAAFGRLLEDLAKDGAPVQNVALVLDRGDHGWMGWVHAKACHSKAEANAFFLRCGGLLAVLRVLRGGDIHPDNLIAAGAYPVIVDLECLFQPAPHDLGIADPLLDPFVFQIGILPVFTSFDGGRTMVPLSAAGAGELPRRPDRRLVHPGTDWMHASEHLVPSFDGPGPVLDGVTLDVRDFASPFVRGYRRTLKALIRQPRAIDAFRRVQVRFLAAPTNLYARLLDGVRAPQALATEDAFRASLNRAAGRTPLVRSKRGWRAILAAEAEALDRLDVPAFRFRPASRMVHDALGRRIGPVMARRMIDSPMPAPAALRADVALVAASLRRPTPLPPCDATPRAVLRTLAERIADLAVPVEGGVTWVRMWEQIPALVSPAGPGLCYGGIGIALALAEAARTLDDERLAACAVRALGPWRNVDALADRLGPGWGRGIGGISAGLAWCARLLDHPALLRDAVRLAHAAPAALRVATGVPDMLEGAAGLALGVAEVHRLSGEPALVEILRICGRAILRASRVAENRRDWPDGARQGLGGLSHGAAGMAAALGAIALATGERRWRTAAVQALAYEDTLFDPARGNWRNLSGGPPFKSTWCHGAPGIALARHAVSDLLPGPDHQFAQSLATAIATTRDSVLEDVDDLCCGEAGRIEILLTLAARHPELHEPAKQALLARLPDWAVGRARFLTTRAGAPEDPSLLRGLGGLVHVLVRHLAPDHAAPVLMPFAMR